MEDKYFNKHIDKADLSGSIDIPKEEKEKFLKALANPQETNERLKKLFVGNAENNLKRLKANQKGTRHYLDFDIDVPKWFKDGSFTDDAGNTCTYYRAMTECLDAEFKKGNYVIVDTSGGYHVLVKTSAVKSNPHNFCKRIQKEYEYGLSKGEEPYVDERGNCKFECIVNDSQIPGLPLPGTYQYDRKVTVLDKDDFE